MSKKILPREEAQKRLDKFNMTLVEYSGMSKPCVVQCNDCGDYIQFKSCVSATTEGNKYGGNHGCRICNNNNISSLKIKLTRCEYIYYQMLEDEIEYTDIELEIMKHKISAIEYKIEQLENCQ